MPFLRATSRVCPARSARVLARGAFLASASPAAATRSATAAFLRRACQCSNGETTQGFVIALSFECLRRVR
eukprot:10283337-Lingulodinium_polyedra.AAC.1